MVASRWKLVAALVLAAPAAYAQGNATLVLDSPPSRTTTERHTGAFSEGASLNLGTQLAPLDPSPVKTIRLDTSHKIIELAPGVKFSAWTFGDQVPGPTVRARVGDRIRFSMTNRSDEAIPGVRITAAPMMHSMDFHAAMVSPQDKYHSIAPGQTIEFEFTLNYAGVFMYHCGTPMILEHIASGMYGAVVVEPREGYPTKADREYVVIQSEFYVKPDPGKRKVGGAPLYVLDSDRLRASQPTHTVFNGVHNGMVKKNPLPAKPGERVRLFVLNVGPSKTSSFHVVNDLRPRLARRQSREPAARHADGAARSSNSAIVEMMIPRRAPTSWWTTTSPTRRRAPSGLIDAGVKSEEQELEHHNMPASATPTDPEAVQGKLAFESKCLACHSLGGGQKLGPDLAGVTKRRTESWLQRWLRSPEKMLETDAYAKALLKLYNNLPMPNQNLPESEIRQYLKYFKWYDEQGARAH
jgi:nitrite reductase (NO-forming)